MEDNELEEGEACDDPDSACDPDTAFSYLDEKLLLVLGDVQKEFEGGVSAEKLGSKFGGYGSFLPTHERTPSILLQQKASGLVVNEVQRTKKSPNEGIVERMKRAAAGLSVVVNNDKACAGHDDGGRAPGLMNEKLSIPDSSFPESRSDENAALNKKVTLRIKMGSDASARKKNTEIYSDFGLAYSSSASLEDDEDDPNSDSDIESSPDRTPLTMIRIMMSHHLPNGILLSPLPDLLSEPFVSKEKVRVTNQEGLKTKLPVSGKSDSIYDPGLVKVEEVGEKVENLKEESRGNLMECKNDSDLGFDYVRKVKKEDVDKKVFKENSKSISKPVQKATGKDSSKPSELSVERQERDAVSESGTGGRFFEASRESKRSFRDKSLAECATEEVENIPKDLGSPFEPPKEVESNREGQSRVSKGDKGTTFFHDSSKDLNDGVHEIREYGKEIPMFEEMLHGKKQHDMNGELVEGKKRSGSKHGDVPHEERRRGSKDASKSTSKNKATGRFVEPDFSATSKEHGKETSEAKKKVKEVVKEGHLSRVPPKEEGKDSLKDIRKSSGKDALVKEVLSKDKMNETFKEGHREQSKAIAKESHKDVARQLKKEINEPRKKEKHKEGLGPELSGKDSSKYIDRDRQKDLVLSRDVPMTATDTTLTNAQYTETSGCNRNSVPEILPVDNGVPAPAVPAPNVTLITENWVCCDRCEKWRLLPPRVGTEQLPTKWRCKMLDWLPGMNNCSVTEEQTTNATQALHNLVAAPPPIQADPLAEQAQPSATVIQAAVASNADLDAPSQEMAQVERARVTVGKKRKVPSVAANEPAPVKSKALTDPAPVPQEGTQGRLGSEDSGHVPPVAEKRRVKEREKPKRSRVNDGTSPLGKEHGQTLASMAMREAKDLKHHADRLKGKDGMERESTDLYLRAALKFLHAAAMNEPAHPEGGENGDNALSLAVYTDTAKLCEFCALNYERSKEMAAAALAYKCAALARMRVVQGKSLSTSRDRAELQSAHQQVPPGESPCSSIASDMDNLSDRLAGKAAASPSLSVQTGGNLIIPARCRSSYNRVLQFVGDTNAAMEALFKSNNAFTGIVATSTQSSFGTEGMDAVKRVVDFGFHDVEGFLRLVRLAMEAIGH